MVDLETLKTPRASEDCVRVKFTLSTAMREKLRRASRASGQDMSSIVEWLIRDNLDTEPKPQPKQEQEQETARVHDDFDFEN